MFDDSGCILCGKPIQESHIYCSEACRINDAGEHSASASNSSYFPSSLSTSPNPSPIIAPTKINRFSQRLSRHSPSGRYSPISSPSISNSDVADISDEDLSAHDASARHNGTFKAGSLRASAHHKVLDHSFWITKLGSPKDIAPNTPPHRHAPTSTSNNNGGSKSVPGISIPPLQYVRKPGPINSLGMQAASKSHRRSDSDVHMQYILPLSSAGSDVSRFTHHDRDSSNSGLSSTPKSKTAVRSRNSSQAIINGHLSDATPGSTSSARRISSNLSLGPRHVSDSQVQTRRGLSTSATNQFMRTHAFSSLDPTPAQLSTSDGRELHTNLAALSLKTHGLATTAAGSTALNSLRGLAKIHGLDGHRKSASQQGSTPTFDEIDAPRAGTSPPAKRTVFSQVVSASLAETKVAHSTHPLLKSHPAQKPMKKKNDFGGPARDFSHSRGSGSSYDDEFSEPELVAVIPRRRSGRFQLSPQGFEPLLASDPNRGRR